MSTPNYLTNNMVNSANNITEAEALKTEQAAAKATTQVTDVMSPETMVLDEPPPNPNYPQYRVRPGEPIVLVLLGIADCSLAYSYGLI